jgi:hypothetical protein
LVRLAGAIGNVIKLQSIVAFGLGIAQPVVAIALGKHSFGKADMRAWARSPRVYLCVIAIVFGIEWARPVVVARRIRIAYLVKTIQIVVLHRAAGRFGSCGLFCRVAPILVDENVVAAWES